MWNIPISSGSQTEKCEMDELDHLCHELVDNRKAGIFSAFAALIERLDGSGSTSAVALLGNALMNPY